MAAITKEDLVARIEQHQANIKKLEHAIAVASANVQACNGAIQECQYQLVLLDKPDEPQA